MDISSLQTIAINVRTLELLGPDGNRLFNTTEEVDENEDPIKEYWTIDLVSEDSPEYQEIFKGQLTENLQKATSRSGAKLTGPQVQSDKLDILVACTRGWKGLMWQGKPFAFSKQNARTLYEKVPMFKEQVDSFVHDRANFMGN